MATKRDVGSAKRFGARYSRRLRLWLGTVESMYRTKKNVCPYCKKPGVRRKAAGIWNCQKCDSTFSGKAYAVGGATQ